MSDIKGTQFVCDHCGAEDFFSEQDLENQDKPSGWVEMPASLEHPSEYSDLPITATNARKRWLMTRCYGPQTFFKFARGVYYSECGRVKICRTRSRNWAVLLDGKPVEGQWWPTLEQAAWAAAQARGMEG